MLPKLDTIASMNGQELIECFIIATKCGASGYISDIRLYFDRWVAKGLTTPLAFVPDTEDAWRDPSWRSRPKLKAQITYVDSNYACYIINGKTGITFAHFISSINEGEIG
ncbi:MAG TPA: hypothetical protein VMY59_06510 [Candidatus Thermoplasmatota archaeon]|nr:hypothetical protein [Candidatus Thermoplasmatota archaeon]